MWRFSLLTQYYWLLLVLWFCTILLEFSSMFLCKISFSSSNACLPFSVLKGKTLMGESPNGRCSVKKVFFFATSLHIPHENIRKTLVFWCFQEVNEKISGMKWVNYFSSHSLHKTWSCPSRISSVNYLNVFVQCLNYFLWTDRWNSLIAKDRPTLLCLTPNE